MTEERAVVYTASDGRGADILIMQFSRAGIEAAKEPLHDPGQAPAWQVTVSGRDEHPARDIVTQFEQDRREAEPLSDADQHDDDSLHNLTTVYSAVSAQQAHFLKNLLIESGINAMVSNEHLHRGSGVDLIGLPTAAEVVVAAKDAQAARQLALEFDRRTIESTEPEVLCSTGSLVEAQAVKGALAQAGIPAEIDDGTLRAQTEIDPFPTARAMHVVVARRDVEAARQIVLRGVDLQAASTDAMTGQEAHESTIDVPPPWPQCPQCDARRTTRCPICLTSGTDFDEVDPEYIGLPDLPEDASDATGSCGSGCSCGSHPHGADPQSVEAEASEPPPPEACQPQLVLMCHTCDDPFVPEFPQRCEWCGHEFAEGYEVEEHVDSEPIPVQAMVVILALVTLVLVACAYFAWLV